MYFLCKAFKFYPLCSGKSTCTVSLVLIFSSHLALEWTVSSLCIDPPNTFGLSQDPHASLSFCKIFKQNETYLHKRALVYLLYISTSLSHVCTSNFNFFLKRYFVILLILQCITTLNMRVMALNEGFLLIYLLIF